MVSIKRSIKARVDGDETTLKPRYEWRLRQLCPLNTIKYYSHYYVSLKKCQPCSDYSLFRSQRCKVQQKYSKGVKEMSK